MAAVDGTGWRVWRGGSIFWGGVVVALLAGCRPAGVGQAVVVAEIKKLGGQVTVDEKSPEKPVVGIDWGMTTAVGDGNLAVVERCPGLVTLDLSGTAIGDSGVEHLKNLAALERLDLSGTKVTDGGMEILAGLSGMKWLNLAQTRVSDKGLEALKGMTGLTYLNLAGTAVSDAGMAALGPREKLETLNLDETEVGDLGIAALERSEVLQDLTLGLRVQDGGMGALAKWPQLRVLKVRGAVTDAGVRAAAAGLPELRELSLSSNRVTDVGVAALKVLPLETLSVTKARLTDRCVDAIGGMKGLKHLYLPARGVSEEGVKKIEEMLPGVEIVRG